MGTRIFAAHAHAPLHSKALRTMHADFANMQRLPGVHCRCATATFVCISLMRKYAYFSRSTEVAASFFVFVFLSCQFLMTLLHLMKSLN